MHKLVVFLCIAAGASAVDYKSLPGLNYDKWWGNGEPVEDTSILPYKIKFPENAVKDLLRRLKNRRDFVPSMDDVAYNYGVNTKTIGYWLDYWANDYNFTEREAYLNQYPQFTTNIRGLNIFFIRIVPEVAEGQTKIPVLMLHGFPGSVREFYNTTNMIIAKNLERKNPVELIMPSLPGFGFSDYTNKTGLGAAEMAVIFKLLMERLGHEKFFIQGGDWGALIGANIATLFPDSIIGYHTNMGVSLTKKSLSMMSIASVNPASVVPLGEISRLYPLSHSFQHLVQESGYFHLQASKPDTIGISVSDSPSGMMAWIFQQFSIASRRANVNDTRGGLDLYTPEELLDNLMFYWIPNKLPTAFRIYAETFNLRNLHMGYLDIPTPVPTVVVQAADELFYMPREMLEPKFTNLVSIDVLDDYGHFLAFEAPELFSELFLSGLDRILAFREQNNMTYSGM